MSDIRKVVINECFGGFSLSRAAFLRLRELGNPNALAEPDYGETWYDGSGPRKPFGNGPGSFLRDIARDDAQLVDVIGELGDAADGDCANLRIVDIPADISWRIEEYDGSEHIAEEHRTWV